MTVRHMPGHLIRRLHQISTAVFAQAMQRAGHDLTSVQFAAMDAVRDAPGIDQAGVAARIACDRATIGGVIDRLEQKGLVGRQVSRRDRRARELYLTDRGRALFEAVRPLVEAAQQDILPGLSAAERAQFIELADRAVRAAEERETG